jgi:hypothetical protein
VLNHRYELEGVGESTPLHPQAQAELEQAAERARASGLPVEAHVVPGVGAAASLVAVAGQLGADLIAMSTHGRGGLSRLVMGSVATGVLRHAAAPLLLVPDGARAGSGFAPEPVSLPAPAGDAPTTVTLSRGELALVLYGLEMAQQAAQDDAAIGNPIGALRDRLERAPAAGDRVFPPIPARPGSPGRASGRRAVPVEPQVGERPIGPQERVGDPDRDQDREQEDQADQRAVGDQARG